MKDKEDKIRFIIFEKAVQLMKEGHGEGDAEEEELMEEAGRRFVVRMASIVLEEIQEVAKREEKRGEEREDKPSILIHLFIMVFIHTYATHK
jgi:hypothetical protein